jgi:hypothetical protein
MRRRLVAPHRLIGIYIGVMAIGSLEKRLDANGERWEDLWGSCLLNSKGNITALALVHRRDAGGRRYKKWGKGDTDGRKDACWSITFSVAFGTFVHCVHCVQRQR